MTTDFIWLLRRSFAEMERADRWHWTFAEPIRRERLRQRRENRQWRVRLFADRYFLDVIDTLQNTLKAHEAASQAWGLVNWLGVVAFANRRPDPSNLAASIASMRIDKEAALYHLMEAAKLLNEGYAGPIKEIIRKIKADSLPTRKVELLWPWFDPDLLRTKGRAAADPDGAWRAWLVRELGARIPSSTHNRAATIAGLLRFVGLTDTTPQNITAQLTRKKKSGTANILSLLDAAKKRDRT